jgi:hypothetical protein
MPRKLSLEQARAKFREAGLEPLFSRYRSNKERLEARTSEGYIILVTVNQLYRRKGYGMFHQDNPHSLENMRKWLASNGKDFTLESGEYVNVRHKMKFNCPKHGLFMSSWMNIQNSKGCPACGLERVSGSNCYMYKPDMDPEEREHRRCIKDYSQFLNATYKRDSYRCQICGDTRGGNLNAHHINGYNWCKEGRTDVNNAVTLCEPCHKQFHDRYGYGHNTALQWSDFIAEQGGKAIGRTL